jgi:beta-galactosidase/beta-glucuronidase
LVCRADDEQPVTVSFGMREVSVQEQRFTINQRPTLLKGVRVELPSAGEAMREFLGMLRTAGINWLPCFTETANLDELLSAADSLGILISLTVERSRNKDAICDLVQRVHHHPSLIFWEVDADREDILAELRAADPIRPVVVRSSGDAPAQVFRPFQPQAERLDRVELRTFSPVSRETESFLAHFGHANAMNVIAVSGFDATSQEHPHQHAEGVRICGERLRANPRVAAYCIEDALTTEGKPREAALAALKDAHSPVRAVISLARTNLIPRE